MKRSLLLPCLLGASSLVLLGGCSDAKWGAEAGGGASQMARTGAASGATLRGTTITSTMVNATVSIIAMHEATMRQRQVAEERGRAWTKKRLAQTAPVRRRRYIAVDTEPDSRTSPQAQKSVMIFDTEAGQVVGRNVYDVASPPPVGEVARFETYSAQYVGPGQ